MTQAPRRRRGRPRLAHRPAQSSHSTAGLRWALAPRGRCARRAHVRACRRPRRRLLERARRAAGGAGRVEPVVALGAEGYELDRPEPGALAATRPLQGGPRSWAAVEEDRRDREDLDALRSAVVVDVELHERRRSRAPATAIATVTNVAARSSSQGRGGWRPATRRGAGRARRARARAWSSRQSSSVDGETRAWPTARPALPPLSSAVASENIVAATDEARWPAGRRGRGSSASAGVALGLGGRRGAGVEPGDAGVAVEGEHEGLRMRHEPTRRAWRCRSPGKSTAERSGVVRPASSESSSRRSTATGEGAGSAPQHGPRARRSQA